MRNSALLLLTHDPQQVFPNRILSARPIFEYSSPVCPWQAFENASSRDPGHAQHQTFNTTSSDQRFVYAQSRLLPRSAKRTSAIRDGLPKIPCRQPSANAVKGTDVLQRKIICVTRAMTLRQVIMAQKRVVMTRKLQKCGAACCFLRNPLLGICARLSQSPGAIQPLRMNFLRSGTTAWFSTNPFPFPDPFRPRTLAHPISGRDRDTLPARGKNNEIRPHMRRSLR